ncbi:TIGR02678 family protein [Streptomyces anulatus]
MTTWRGHDAAERQDAIRALLATPLLTRTDKPQELALVRRHYVAVRTWFETQLGWRLDLDRDCARLYKVPADIRFAHVNDAPTGRQAALVCMVLAVLEDCDEQTDITELAERITTSTTAEPAVRTFDATRYTDRADLVAAIRLLCHHRVLTADERAERAGQERHYIDGGGNALYTVHHRNVALMLASPIPPSQATAADELLRQDVCCSDDRSPHHLRHQLLRRLIDEPALYVEDLTHDEEAYYLHHRHELATTVEKALNTRVEIRDEGAAVIDDDLTDLPFPDTSTRPYAALLLADALWHEQERTLRRRIIPHNRVRELSDEIARQLLQVVKNISNKPLTGARVHQEAQDYLARLRLIDILPTGIRLRPVLARYRSTLPAHLDAEQGLLYGSGWSDIDKEPTQ